MAKPVILDVTATGSNTTGTTPWPVTYPAYNTGDLIVVCTGNDDNVDVTGVTPPSGPDGETINTLVAQNTVSQVRESIFWYIATSTESSGSLSFTPSAGEQYSAVCFRVAAGDFDAADPFGAFVNGGHAADTTSNTTAFSAGSDDGGSTLLVWVCADASAWNTTELTGWSYHENRDRGALGVLLAERDDETTASESIPSYEFDLVGTNSDPCVNTAFIIRQVQVVTHEGSGTPSLPLLTASGAGKKTRKGTGTPSLPLLTAAGVGEFTPATVTHESEGTPSLPLLTASGAGKKTRKGTGTPALPILTASGAGKKGRAGTGAATLPILTADGAGTKTRKGTGTPSLPLLTADGAGTKTRKGAGTPSLPLLTADGSALLEGVEVGSGDTTLPLLTAEGVARVVSPVVGASGGGYGFGSFDRHRKRREKDELAEEIARLEVHLGIEPDVKPDIYRIQALVEQYQRESAAALSNRAKRAFEYAERARTKKAWELAFREYQKAQEQEELNLILSVALDD